VGRWRSGGSRRSERSITRDPLRHNTFSRMGECPLDAVRSMKRAVLAVSLLLLLRTSSINDRAPARGEGDSLKNAEPSSASPPIGASPRPASLDECVAYVRWYHRWKQTWPRNSELRENLCELFGGVPDFLDEWNHRLHLERIGGEVFLCSNGPNGIYEQGNGDDIIRAILIQQPIGSVRDLAWELSECGLSDGEIYETLRSLSRVHPVER
jgi:hypothetical protein